MVQQLYHNLQPLVPAELFVVFGIGTFGRSEIAEMLYRFLHIEIILHFSFRFTALMTPHPYLFIIIFIGVAVVFPMGPLALAWLWRGVFQPPKPGALKNATYECGIESVGDAQIQFRSQYYLYAIIFLIFDVEAVFLIPFAVAFTGLPLGGFVAILIFLLLLIEGLLWAWGKGCLDWAR